MGNLLKCGKKNNTAGVDDKYSKFTKGGSKIDRLKRKLLYFRKKRKENIKLEKEIFFEWVLEDPKLKIGDQPITKFYKFGKVLGLDRNSVVKHATLIHDPDFHVAVKAVNFNNTQGYYNALLQEILALKQADHPCIVNLLEVYYDTDNVYLVMEKIEGVTLHYIIDNEDKATERDTVIIIEQLLKIVVYLNKINIAHGDIRPNNVLINPATLSLKLLDFGSSKYLVDEVDFNDKIKEPLYAAPEMLQKKFHQKGDVWSIGVIAYHLLSGKVPFCPKKKSHLYKDIMNMKINYDNLDWMNRSKYALDFISKTLTPDTSKRISASQALKHPWIASMKQYDESDVDYDILERCGTYNKINAGEAGNRHSSNSMLKQEKGNPKKTNSKLIYQILNVIITNCKGKTFRRFDELFKMLDVDGHGLVSIDLYNNYDSMLNPIRQETLKYNDPKLKEKTSIASAATSTIDKPSTEGKIGYSKFGISSVDWLSDIRVDGIKKIFHLLAGKHNYITFDRLKRFFRRRLEEVSEVEFNELGKNVKGSMDTARYIAKPIMTFELFQDIIFHQNSLKHRQYENTLETMTTNKSRKNDDQSKGKPFELYYERSNSDSLDGIGENATIKLQLIS